MLNFSALDRNLPPLGIQQLRETGLIGIVPGSVPLAQCLPLVDALLAAPVLVVVVQLNGRLAFDLLADLKEKTAGYMLVGCQPPAGEIPPFLPSALHQLQPHFLMPTLEQAAGWQEAGYPVIPHATTPAESQHPYPLCTVPPSAVWEWPPHLPRSGWIPAGEIFLHDVPRYAQAGCCACALPLWHSQQTHPRPTIVLARHFHTLWQQGVSHGF